MKRTTKSADPQPNTPAHGPRSNPGNPEAGVGHTRGQNRPASVRRGRHGKNPRPNDVHRVPPDR
jgi:hypothetical protein